MKKLHILQTPVRFLPYTGGVEIYVLNLSQELVKIGHSVKVICADEPKSDLNKIDGVNVKRLNYLGKIANTNITAGLFYALLREKFDIIHTHFPTPWSADISMLISYLKRKPLVLSYHNDANKKGFLGILVKIYNHIFLKLLLKRADKILILQPDYLFISKHLQKYSKKITVITPGVNTKVFYKKNTKKIPNQIFFLSILDKYHRYKGLSYLLEAIKLVSIEIPNIKLVVGGAGELLGEYKALSKNLGIESSVEFRGFIENDNLVSLYNQSELFCLPSISNEEGFGMVLIEALACKTPVITTEIVGIDSEIKQNNCGIVVRPRDSRDLANSIVRLLKNPDMIKEMGENGRKLVERRFSWQKIATQVNDIYQEVLQERE